MSAVLALAGLVVVAGPTHAADVGFVGPGYSGTTAPTGQKPQSKLWIADGQWWGALFDKTSRDFHIFRYDWAQNTWSDTGVLVDTRTNIFIDALWDGSRLYIVAAGSSATNSGHSPKLTRYSYNAASDSWSLDSGFPTQIATGGAEAVVMDKDSTGRLWATFTQGAKVWLTHSKPGDDTTWVPRFQLPTPGNQSSVDPDDISAVVAFDGDKIGVLWSNEVTQKMYWAFHVDTNPDSQWTLQVAYDQPEGADDHINLKSLVGDDSGRVFAVVKTSMDRSSDPLINLLVLRGNGSWDTHEYARQADDVTRAIVLIDPVNRHLYVFASGPCCSGGKVYYKRTSLDNPSFGTGLGTVFIASGSHPKVNNPTSTKQSVSSATGLLVLAGDDSTRTYLYNRLDLGDPPPPPPPPVDTTPPDTTLDSAPPASTSSTSASFEFSANEPNSTFRCSLDGAASSVCTSPKTYSGLATGGHTFAVTAVDAAGNEDPTPATHSWTVQEAGGPIFAEDFSSGSFATNGWEVGTGADGTATIVAGAVHAGDLGARFTTSTATGSTASIRKTLAAPETTLEIGWDALVEGGARSGQTIALAKLYNAEGSRVLSLHRDSSSGELRVQDQTTTSTPIASLSVGEVVRLTLRVQQNAAGQDVWSVSVGGIVVASSTTANLGSADFQRVRFGDDSLRRALDHRVDNVEVLR